MNDRLSLMKNRREHILQAHLEVFLNLQWIAKLRFCLIRMESYSTERYKGEGVSKKVDLALRDR